MPGHSLERDGLSPIPTVHRDGLGNALRPPLFRAAMQPVDANLQVIPEDSMNGDWRKRQKMRKMRAGERAVT